MTYPVLTQFLGPTTAAAKQPVMHAIEQASAKTGISFSYLVNNAQAESSLNPTARAKTSSASGLYQFTQKTWLQMVRDHGADVGLSKYAACVNDDCHVADARIRRDILALRLDPNISAIMAAKYASLNAAHLEKTVGDRTAIGDTEMYLAHVFGPGGATKFIKNMADNPDEIAARVFDREVQANPGLFYKDGQAQSFQQIYDRFADKFNHEPAATTTAQDSPQNINRVRNPSASWGSENDQTGTPASAGGTYPSSQERDNIMIGQVNNNYRTWVRRGASGAGDASSLFGGMSRNEIQKGMMSDRTAYDFKGLRDKALDPLSTTSISRGFKPPDHRNDDDPESDILTAHQPALLVMAQNYRHNERARYNG